MASQKPTIKVLPATEKDALVAAHIEALAFDGPSAYALKRSEPSPEDEEISSLGRVMFGPPNAKQQAARADEFRERFKSSPETHIYKAVLEEQPHESNNDGSQKNEEKIVGIGMWKFFASNPFPVEETWKDLPWEFAASPAACNEFFGGVAKLRTKYMGGKKAALLELLVIHPEYQGLGAGRKLLERGLEDAAALNLDEAFLEATDAGRPLYQKFGWKDVEVFSIDLSKYGGKGIRNNTFMHRIPTK